MIFNNKSYNEKYVIENLLNECLTTFPINKQKSKPRSTIYTRYSRLPIRMYQRWTHFFSPVSLSDVENTIVVLKKNLIQIHIFNFHDSFFSKTSTSKMTKRKLNHGFSLFFLVHLDSTTYCYRSIRFSWLGLEKGSLFYIEHQSI